MGNSLRHFQACPYILPRESQSLFPPRSLHPSYQLSSPYSFLSLAQKLHSMAMLGDLLCTYSFFLVFLLFCVVAEGYWLKQSSMSPYAGLILQILYILFLSFWVEKKQW